ncbi:uncharacterized protein [Argopecten irradians]|uniref:uncharacterized protein n=1 Tax=Argopecten irradians TaxID=31199 RepID=UPI003719B53A
MSDKIVCEVCKKEFSGRIPAQQHYESKAHQKALRNKELIEKSKSQGIPTQFNCDVCGVFMNSSDQYQRHISSPKHLEKAERDNKFAGYNGTAPEQQSPGHAGLGYDFDGQRGYCYVCDLELSSRPVAEQHINGEKHAKKKRALQSRIATQSFASNVARDSCNACGIKFSSHQESEAHFAGRSHKEKMASLEHSMPTTGGNPTLSTTMETSYYPTGNLACLPTGTTTGRSEAGRGGADGQAQATLASNNGVYEFDGKTGQCHVCNIAFTSEESANAHLKGSRHRKALVRSGLEKTVDTTRVSNSKEYIFNGDRGVCLVCDIELTSERHAHDHLSGSKHAKAVQRRAEAQESSDTQEYVMNGGRGFCNVCQIELTSTEHKNEHIAGKPHAKAKTTWESWRQGKNGIMPSSSNTGGTSPGIKQVSPRKSDLSPWYIQPERRRPDASESSDSSTLEDVYELKTSENFNQNAVKTSENFNKNAEVSSYGKTEIIKLGAEESNGDYWFSGTTGYCKICSIDLTSNAHASQHLNGKNHRKAKERAQTRSSTDTDLYCQICKVPFSGQESAKQHYNSDKHKKREQIKKTHLTVESPVSTPGQKPSANTKLYPCYVCGCYLNSKEQLETHEKSVSHLAAKDELNSLGFQETLLMTNPGSSREERIVRVTQGSYGTGHSPGNTAASSREGSCSSGDTVISGVVFEPLSLDQHGSLDPASLLRTTSGLGDLDETFTKSVYHPELPDQPRVALTSLNANLASNTPKEKEIHKPSISSQISKNSDSSYNSARSDSHSRSPSVGLDSQRLANQSGHSSSLSSQSTNQSVRSSLGSDSDNRMPSLEPIDDLPELVPVCTSLSEAKIKEDMNKTEKNYAKENDIRRKNEGRERRKVETTTSGYVAIPRKAVDISDIESMESGGSSSPHSSGRQARRGQGTDSARAVRNRTSRKTGHDNSLSQESESDPDKDTDSSLEKAQSNCQPKSPSQLMSLISQKLPNISQRSSNQELTDAQKSVFKNYRHYCPTCKVPMDTAKALQDHMKGRLHRQKSAKEPAPSRQHPPVVKSLRTQDGQETNFTETVPRSYQLELFRKVLAGDRICFLPTGTGKTLIGCMAIGAMLELNPSYQVLFLVTKVLLVLQQAKYIRRQLAHREFKRFDPDDPSKVIERELKIAELCGGQQSTGGVALWQHDIIIATAAYCENLLTDGVLHWEDQCLVIFDEAHHCNKNHSFKNLMVSHHYSTPEQSRCKVLGLTASPAGKKNYSMTVDMLRQLQINMGDSLISVVEEEKVMLEAFMSNAKIHIAVMEPTPNEEEFQRDLRVYLLQCYMRLAAETNITEHSNLGLSGTGKRLSTDEMNRHAQDLTDDVLDELQALIDVAKPTSAGVDKKIEVQNLKGHIRCICMTISVAAEVGTAEALEEMQVLMATDLNHGFDYAQQIGISCENILRSIATQQQILKSNLKFQSESVPKEMSSSVQCLMQQLMNPEYIKWNTGIQGRQPMALVLVKQRATATSLHTVLQDHPEIIQKGLAVEKIVGHGAGSAERGMSVAQQRKTLEEIKDHKFQVVIATAVAEEGIDLPECELVVSMNPPSTMTALVQMRGRARKRDSHFVIVCNDSKEEAKLSDLLVREHNMIKAASFLVQNQNIKQNAV